MLYLKTKTIKPTHLTDFFSFFYIFVPVIKMIIMYSYHSCTHTHTHKLHTHTHTHTHKLHACTRTHTHMTSENWVLILAGAEAL